MALTLFVGCSLTSGEGFELGKDEPGLWVNLLHEQNSKLRGTKLLNNSKAGASNSDIFYNAVSSLVEHKPEYAFVQWTNGPRYNIQLGIETFSTNQYFGINGAIRTHNLHSIRYSKKYLEDIKNRFLTLHHPHAVILDIVKYVNTLITLAKTTNTKIFFINGLCPWDDQFFNKVKNGPPSNYTSYTQHILESSTRDDNEVFSLYDTIHNDYTQAGSIQENYWLNLYNSMRSSQIDVNNDNLHPGILSNQHYANTFNQQLNK